MLGRLAQAARVPLTPVFSGEVHTGNPRRLTGAHERARAELGFSATIGLGDGLQRYANWFKREGAD